MKARSIKGNTAGEIQLALDQAGSAGYQPTLAFVFLSIKQDIAAITTILDKAGICVFGATTGGEFIDGDIGHGSIAILLLDMNPSNFLLLLEDYNEKAPGELARAMTSKAMEKFKNPSFILCYSVEVATGLAIGEPIIRAIEAVAGKEATIWGGGAGDDLAFLQTNVFSNHQSINKGILLLVMDGDKVQVKGLASAGQKAVGTEKTVTKSKDNVVFEIDHQPAAEMVLKYLGLQLTQEEAETFNPGIIVFSLLREKGDPVLRSSGVFNWANKSITINGSINEGDKIRLTLPPDFEVIDVVSNHAARMKKSEMQEADALLVFSCVGRLGEFGPMAGDEIEGIRKVFNVPMAGFFTYGEFGRATNGNNEFHNNTCCWVALKER